jgi:hypothetical protein
MNKREQTHIELLILQLRALGKSARMCQRMGR